MQFNPQEISALAQAESAAPRMNMYAAIHKALRAFMADTLTGLGRVDTDDDLDLSQSCDRVLALMDFCRSHLQHENEFVHTAMERRAPGSAGSSAGRRARCSAAVALTCTVRCEGGSLKTTAMWPVAAMSASSSCD